LEEVRGPRVLHGLGGVGKTQLAAEYAHRHASHYRIRWWIPAEQPAAIPGHLATLARQLGIPEQADQTVTVAALLAELGRRGDWLLVFDNAEDPHDLGPYWPSTEAGGRVLVTSRNPNWQPLAATLPVDVWPRADAVAFLHRRAGLDRQDAYALAKALGDLPLALEQAAAYVQQTTTPPGEYLELLASRARELFALGRPATSEQTIATVWTVSVRQLREHTPAAEDLLVLLAFLAADDIPRALPAQHPDQLPERLAATVHDPLAYQQAIAALRRYSLLKTSPDGQTLAVHRLIQAVTRHELDPEQERSWASVALGLVQAAFPDRLGDPTAWPEYTELLPHALAVIDHASAHGIEADATTWLLQEAGVYLWQRAEHQQARALHERALAIDEARLGKDHPDTVQSLNNLALVLADQGDLDGARTLLERALTIFEGRLGPDHPDTANSLNNLAGVLHEQGDLDTARTLYERALAIYEARLGKDHPATGRILSNLALVLAGQGDLDRARTLLERALAIWEARVGANHPDTASGLSNLATVLRGQKQGDLDTARALHERALAIRKARLGPDHPDTVRSRERLAAVVAALENRQ
jgi:tetratricopeptide (TPR) repeat protein